MPLASINYKFSQRFKVPVDEAFAWSIDYEPGPGDLKRMGAKGTRKVQRLTPDTVILEDTKVTDEGRVTKTRLVRIYHERRSFVNTHIGGPTPHSQYLYEFFPEKGGGSRLDFTGLLLLPTSKRLPARQIAKLAQAERKADSDTWKSLAKAMESELKR